MKTQQLDSFMRAYCEKNIFSGSLRITCRDEIIYQGFFGRADFERDLPLDENTVFSLYSLSKPFCAIGLLKLYDRGLVDIDRHPGEYLPEMRGFDPRVTIRRMLQHISGLPDFEQTKAFKEKYLHGPYGKLREQLPLLAEYPMLFAPGTGFRYENINFTAAALIIENVSGLPYEVYMKKEVFYPLDMKTVRVDRPGLSVKNRAKGYELCDDRPVPVERATDWMFGAGDLVGTLDDVYCLNQAIKRKLLLKEKTWEQALSPSPIAKMGMGCTLDVFHGRKTIRHNGGHTGFRSLHLQFPEDDFDIILLCNTGIGTPREDISEAIGKIWFDGAPSSLTEMDKGYI